MFTLNTISRALTRPIKLTTAQRTVGTTKHLSSKFDGSGKRPKSWEENDFDQFKQRSDGGQISSKSDCKDAYTECSQRIVNLEKQVDLIRQVQQVSQQCKVNLDSQKCDKARKTPSKCCDIKPPKKDQKGDKKTPYVIGLILAAAGILYLLFENRKKIEEEEKKDDKKEDKKEEEKGGKKEEKEEKGENKDKENPEKKQS